MDASEPDLENISFIDPVWLQQYGLGPENALDYFALSPFYDKSCNNQQCRMQGVDPREGLTNLTGLEYILEDLPEEPVFTPPGHPPPQGPLPKRLFVIKRQLRKSRTSVEVQAVYYIMEGTIYQSPTVARVFKSRLTKFSHHINNAFEELSKLVELDNTGGGHTWQWQKEAIASQARADEASGGRDAERESKATPKLVVDKLLMGLVERYIDGDKMEAEAGREEEAGHKRPKTGAGKGEGGATGGSHKSMGLTAVKGASDVVPHVAQDGSGLSVQKVLQ